MNVRRTSPDTKIDKDEIIRAVKAQSLSWQQKQMPEIGSLFNDWLVINFAAECVPQMIDEALGIFTPPPHSISERFVDMLMQAATSLDPQEKLAFQIRIDSQAGSFEPALREVFAPFEAQIKAAVRVSARINDAGGPVKGVTV